jgi:hypothetical protein
MMALPPLHPPFGAELRQLQVLRPAWSCRFTAVVITATVGTNTGSAVTVLLAAAGLQPLTGAGWPL